jgi:hypothetical protein
VKRGLWILLLGVAVALVLPALYYRSATAPTHTMLEQNGGELEWLKKEFRLNDAQFQAVRRLHEEYAPKCEQMCARIAEANARADRLIGAQTAVTPELAAALQECATVHAECHRAMLGHIYSVAAEMPRDQAARYIQIMKGRVLEPGLGERSLVHPAGAAR